MLGRPLHWMTRCGPGARTNENGNLGFNFRGIFPVILALPGEGNGSYPNVPCIFSVVKYDAVEILRPFSLS